MPISPNQLRQHVLFAAVAAAAIEAKVATQKTPAGKARRDDINHFMKHVVLTSPESDATTIQAIADRCARLHVVRRRHNLCAAMLAVLRALEMPQPADTGDGAAAALAPASPTMVADADNTTCAVVTDEEDTVGSCTSDGGSNHFEEEMSETDAVPDLVRGVSMPGSADFPHCSLLPPRSPLPHAPLQTSLRSKHQIHSNLQASAWTRMEDCILVALITAAEAEDQYMMARWVELTATFNRSANTPRDLVAVHSRWYSHLRDRRLEYNLDDMLREQKEKEKKENEKKTKISAIADEVKKTKISANEDEYADEYAAPSAEGFPSSKLLNPNRNRAFYSDVRQLRHHF